MLNNCFSWTGDYALGNAALYATGLSCKGKMLFNTYRILQLLVCKSVPLHRVIPTQAEDPTVAFVELHKVPVSPFLQPVKEYLNAVLLSKVLTAPSNLMSFSTLLGVHSVPLSRPLIKTINSVGPSVDP